MITTVILSRKAQKDLKKLPRYIIEALAAWVENVETDGLEETRKIPGYHDEPLRGSRKGQRSIRLNRSYRAIYVIKSDQRVEFVSVEEVHNHEY
ncbi:type II toxin-antitoxin system RelE family toxin [uncultured Bdellovibrio sp.]|uniref:type II toxin-antitoxin system RelE family toxin n=1 Tax=Bdellovibrio sp. HCB-162 TaxID=3394234 RepID=UPI0025FA6ADB|nr:type II toxin-antitoxin system mRNA interferase toxin, RelE/StbE family [uncultured Bdellovibrio sp.]